MDIFPSAQAAECNFSLSLLCRCRSGLRRKSKFQIQLSPSFALSPPSALPSSYPLPSPRPALALPPSLFLTPVLPPRSLQSGFIFRSERTAPANFNSFREQNGVAQFCRFMGTGGGSCGVDPHSSAQGGFLNLKTSWLRKVTSH